MGNIMLIVLEVAGDKCKVIMDSSLCNQQIIVVFGLDEDFSLWHCSQLSAKKSKLPSNRVGDTQKTLWPLSTSDREMSCLVVSTGSWSLTEA